MTRRLLFAFYLSCAACAPVRGATLAFPNVPTPVLLGPVDRVGGGASAPAPLERSLDVEVERRIYAGKRARVRIVEPRSASFAALEATGARKDVDVAIDDARAGSWFLWLVVAAVVEEWVDATGAARRGAP